jgi:hypothetical protein
MRPTNNFALVNASHLYTLCVLYSGTPFVCHFRHVCGNDANAHYAGTFLPCALFAGVQANVCEQCAVCAERAACAECAVCVA